MNMIGMPSHYLSPRGSLYNHVSIHEAWCFELVCFRLIETPKLKTNTLEMKCILKQNLTTSTTKEGDLLIPFA